MRKLERTSQLHCRFLRQRLSTLSCHSYYVHLILRHSVREGTSLNHAFRLNSQTHSQSAQVTCHITDGNPNKEGRDNVPEGPACRPHQRHIGYNHRGRWCVCVCVRACDKVSGQSTNGEPSESKNETLVSKLHSFPLYLPSNSTVVSFTVVRPGLNNTSLIDVSCILPMPLNGTNKQSKFIQNSKVQFHVH